MVSRIESPTAMPTDGIDLLEAVEIDHDDRRPHVLVGARERDRGLEAIEKQLAVRAGR